MRILPPLQMLDLFRCSCSEQSVLHALLEGAVSGDSPQDLRIYVYEIAKRAFAERFFGVRLEMPSQTVNLAALIDASGARSTILLAHDWGAVIAWYFAMRQVRPLERLVIMIVPHPGVMDRVVRTRRQLLRSWYALFYQISKLPERLLRARNYRAIGDAFRNMAVDKSRFPDAVLEVYKQNAAQLGALTAMINYYRALIGGGGGARQRQLGYPAIDVLTLMIWGERDSALGKETTWGPAVGSVCSTPPNALRPSAAIRRW